MTTAEKAASFNALASPQTTAVPTLTSPSASSNASSKSSPATSKWRKLLSVVTYTPKRCRYDPAKPPRFSLPLNLLFSFAATFTVANLYYNHPILNILARDFSVTDQRASLIPTLAQAGYAGGLLFPLTPVDGSYPPLKSFHDSVCPLGDIFKRRDFVLILVLFTATAWIGLCITNSFPVFCFLTFITSLTTVTPQLMLPLVGDLAPPHRRATALSIVVSGLILGILIARVLSGVVTYYTTWRNIYWLSCGLQYFIFLLLYLFMPDYPSTNPSGIPYHRILFSILTLLVHEPTLVQACLVGCLTSMTFTSYWTTLTFLLSSPPYSYSNLIIGLFALIGILGMSFGPPFSRFVIDKFVPLFSVIVGELFCLTGIVIGTYTVPHTVAGPVVQAFMLDIGLQTSQIANRSAIYTIAPKARNRVNTAYMVSVFVGQLVGTAAGNALYAHGGWVRSGSASVGFVGAALVFCFARGPWEKGWVGWRGGWGLRRRDLAGPGAAAVTGGQGTRTGDDEEKGPGAAGPTAGSGTRAGDDEEKGRGLEMAKEGVGAVDAGGEKDWNVDAEAKGEEPSPTNGQHEVQQQASSPEIFKRSSLQQGTVRGPL